MISEKVQVFIELLKQGDGAARASSDLKALETQTTKTSSAMSALGKIATGIGLSLLIRDVLQANSSLESMRAALTNITGSSQKADAELKFLHTQANRLGSEFERIVPSFVGFSAAARGTALEGEGARKVFVGILEAGAALKIAVKSALFAAFPSLRGVLGSGGMVGRATPAAIGGIFPRMMAAGGVQGVGEVSQATFFPRFNVIAGEAGREMLTVLAKPQTIDFNGIPAVVGQAGSRQLAIIDAVALGSARMMAGGGVAGGFPGPQARGGLSGSATVNVVLGDGLEARLVNNSIEGALVRVNQEVNQDSRLSHSIKRLSS